MDWLIGQGHDAVHLRSEGLHRLPDIDIFAKAGAERRTIVTFDLDFGEIIAFSERKTVSAVVLRLRNASNDNVIARLSNVLPSVAEALKSGAIVLIEDATHRIRRLPVGGSG